MRRSFLLVALLALGPAPGCRESSLAACNDEPDITGHWKLTVGPVPVDAGQASSSSITDSFEIDAELEQAGATDFLGLGHFVYGTLTASDPRYFSTLAIPRLLKNDGSKSGAILGCELRINVPIASPVTDDNMPQGPLRIAIAGQVVGRGQLRGVDGSRLVRADDPSDTPHDFTWQGERP